MDAERMALLLLERLGLQDAEALVKLMGEDLDTFRGEGRGDVTVWQKPVLYFALVALTVDARARTRSGAELGQSEALERLKKTADEHAKANPAVACNCLDDSPRHETDCVNHPSWAF